MLRRFLDSTAINMGQKTISALGGQARWDFTSLQNLSGYYGYVVGLFVKVAGTMVQSAGTAVLAHAQIQDILSGITWQYSGGEVCSNFSGRALTNVNKAFGILGSRNIPSQIHYADFANDTSDHALAQYYTIPAAPNFFRNTNLAEEDLAGAIPFERLTSDGSLVLQTSATNFGAWGVKSGTSLTIDVYPLVVYLKNPITFVRPQYTDIARGAADDVYTLPGQGIRTPLFIGAFDDAFSTFADPDSNMPVLKVDGASFQSHVPGAILNKIVGLMSEDAVALATYGMDDTCVLVSPQRLGSLAGYPTGNEIVVLFAGKDHGAHRVVAFALRQPYDNEISDDLTRQGLTPAAVSRAVSEWQHVVPTSGDRGVLSANGVPMYAWMSDMNNKANEIGARPITVITD
jgi:hypothetical protein